MGILKKRMHVVSLVLIKRLKYIAWLRLCLTTWIPKFARGNRARGRFNSVLSKQSAYSNRGLVLGWYCDVSTYKYWTLKYTNLADLNIVGDLFETKVDKKMPNIASLSQPMLYIVFVSSLCDTLFWKEQSLLRVCLSFCVNSFPSLASQRVSLYLISSYTKQYSSSTMYVPYCHTWTIYIPFFFLNTIKRYTSR